MKKILYFIPEFPKLTETFIEREVSKLVDLGVLDVRVLSVKKASGFLSPNLTERVTFRDISILDFFRGIKYLISSFGRLHDILVIIFSVNSPKLAVSNMIYFLKSVGYAYVIDSFKPDHIHSHFLSYPSTIVMFVSILLAKPFSISGHARDVFVDGELIPQKVARAKFISICNTYAWSKCIELSKGENASNVHKIYHGMNLTSLLAKEPKMVKPSRPLIFAGSRLVEKKGLKYLIEASKTLKERGVNHEVHIVGPGPLYQQLVDMVNFLGLSDTVFIPGAGKGVSNADIMEYFKIADIFAHPSIETGTGDVDGVPTFVIESSMAKVPVVTTRAGSITDLIDDETGVLVKQKDPYSLADGLEKLIVSPELRKSLGQKAYDRAKVMFDLDVNVTSLQTLFLE